MLQQALYSSMSLTYTLASSPSSILDLELVYTQDVAISEYV